MGEAQISVPGVYRSAETSSGAEWHDKGTTGLVSQGGDKLVTRKLPLGSPGYGHALKEHDKLAEGGGETACGGELRVACRENALLLTKKMYYVGGRLLAHRLHLQMAQHRVNSIQTQKGAVTTDEELILKESEDFYAPLYTVE
ncbi:hypothetical protein NDU88_011080 [Pleurodeles waltl]|uniref:Uncharacterized protein n=1 Tax=Pleurodeles waltl TaxID=8319 RepID=A0AAV7PXW1_PLEWA|nr:hypothetical protein NDU88_011080 [Pleurodeles waltl]